MSADLPPPRPSRPTESAIEIPRPAKRARTSPGADEKPNAEARPKVKAKRAPDAPTATSPTVDPGPLSRGDDAPQRSGSVVTAPDAPVRVADLAQPEMLDVEVEVGDGVGDDPPADTSVGDEPAPEQEVPAAAGHLPYWPALDGLRGIAVAAVLVYHARFTWAAGGFLGVSTFFTLSGFLITSLLLAERAGTGKIALREFWIRRIKRLLPASLVALVFVVIYGIFEADAQQLAELRGDGFAALAYVANWRFIVSETSYGDLFATPSPLQHFWSLAIEEQFYLVFPLLTAGVLALARGKVERFAAVLGLGIVASVVAGFVLYDGPQQLNRVYNGTDTRAAELLIGALLAVGIARLPRLAQIAQRRVMALIGAAGLTLTLVAFWMVELTSDWLYRGGFAAFACVTALVICAGVQPDSWVARPLSFAPFVALGKISYGVYLFHWPIFLWLAPPRFDLEQWPLFGLRMAATLSLSLASYHLVEQPIRRGSHLNLRQLAVGAPVAIAATALGLVIVTAGADAAPNPLEGLAAATAPNFDDPAFSSDPAAPPQVTDPSTADPDGTTSAVTDPNAEPAPTTIEPVEIAPPSPLGDVASVVLAAPNTDEAEVVATVLTRSDRAQVASRHEASCGTTQIPFDADLTLTEACDGWAERWITAVEAQDPTVMPIVALAVLDADMSNLFDTPLDAAQRDWFSREFASLVDRAAAAGAVVVGVDLAPGAPLSAAFAEVAGTRVNAEVVRLTGVLRGEPGAPATELAEGVATSERTETLLFDAMDRARVITFASGTDTGPVRVLVVGDSVGADLSFGLADLGVANGRTSVWNTAIPGCGIIRGGDKELWLGEVQTIPDGCNQWETLFAAQIAEFDPHVVVAASYIGDLWERRLEEWDRFAVPGDPLFDDYMVSEYTTAIDVLTVGGATVLWANSPCAFDLPPGTPPGEGRVFDADRIEYYNEVLLPRVQAARPDSMQILDFMDEICDDGDVAEPYPGIGGFRDDGVHFSDAAERHMAEWLGPVLEGFGPTNAQPQPIVP